MNFENLAHGAFAMLGGDACVVLLDGFGVRFLATLPIVASVSALVGVVLERTPYRRLYGASHLDQGLFSVGLVWFLSRCRRRITFLVRNSSPCAAMAKPLTTLPSCY